MQQSDNESSYCVQVQSCMKIETPVRYWWLFCCAVVCSCLMGWPSVMCNCFSVRTQSLNSYRDVTQRSRSTPMLETSLQRSIHSRKRSYTHLRCVYNVSLWMPSTFHSQLHSICYQIRFLSHLSVCFMSLYLLQKECVFHFPFSFIQMLSSLQIPL